MSGGIIYAVISAMAGAIMTLFAWARSAINGAAKTSEARIEGLREHCERLEQHCERLDVARVDCERDRTELHKRIEENQDRMIAEFAALARRGSGGDG